MKKLPEDVVRFFQRQRFVIVSTVDACNTPHSSCKGVVDINPKGLIYLLDLYKGRTLGNLRRSPNISITAVDEHKFAGYCLKGTADIAGEKELKPALRNSWDKKIAGRITHRLLRNINGSGKKGHGRHPESLLPHPQYTIVMKVKEIINLMPHDAR